MTRGSQFAILVFDRCKDFVFSAAPKHKNERDSLSLIKDMGVLLAQFADDTTLLDSSEYFWVVVSSPSMRPFGLFKDLLKCLA